LTPAERAALGRSVSGYVDGSVIELTLRPAAAHSAYAGLGAPGPRGAARAAAIGIGSLDRAAASFGATFSAEFAGERVPVLGSRATDFTRYVIVHLPDGARYDDALARFAASPEVEGVSPLPVLPLSIVPNDSLYGSEWWLTDFPPSIGAPTAWNSTVGDTNDVIAVIDAGVNPNHPDLGGRVAGGWGNLWVNRAELNGTPGMDDDGNGFVDDVWGWDFVDLSSASLAATGEDWRDPDNDPNDMVGHGTACAGLIGALTDNYTGMAGVDWNARIMALRIGWAFPGALPGEGEVRMDFAAQAIRYATRNGARILNMSFSNLDTDGLGAAVTDAVAAGVIPVVAAGNNGAPNDLGLRPDVISVAATDASGQLAYFSNSGDGTTIAAPGVSMQSLFSGAIGTDSLGLRTPAYSQEISGTSFAAPLVAGTAALVESQERSMGRRLLDAYAMKLRLVETRKFSGPPFGILDAGRAVTDPRPPGHMSSALPMGGSTVGASAAIPLQGGGAFIVCVTDDSAMVALDGRSRDTVWVARLADLPVTGVAAADMNTGYGTGLFCGTASGTIEGFDLDGHRLTGFPTAALGVGLTGGPALGDLDGDGSLEVICGADDGTVMAWNADGSDHAGWPRVVGSARVLPLALADIDGVTGVEVVAASEDGHVTVLRGNGTRLTGWPKILTDTPRAPVVAYDGSIVFTEYAQLHRLSIAGTERAGYPISLGGPAVSDLALADLLGNRHEDVVVALDQPPRLAVIDTSGAALPGWPRSLRAGAQGTPVVAPLPGTGRNGVLIQSAGDLLAFDQVADSLAWFPEPGLAGAASTIADVDGDGVPEVVAGTGPDPAHHFYIYASGPGLLHAPTSVWPTPRANPARTGTNLYSPMVVVPDRTPPGRVTDLTVKTIGDTFVVLRWTATGTDSTLGMPRYYEVHADTHPIGASDWGASPYLRRMTPTAHPPAAESLDFGGLPPAAHLHFALRAFDEAGNFSLVSNDVAADLHVGGPLDGAQDIALAPTTNPAIPPFSFYWHSDPGAVGTSQRLRLYDITGRVRLERDLGTAAGGIWAWDGRDDHGNPVRSGVYFARLQSGSRSKTTRIVLLR
jgi:subtilisin family serine protease